MRRRLFAAAAIAIPLILVVIIAIMIIRHRAETSQTEELLAQWQAAGGVLTLAELKPEPIPDEQNATVLYERAFAINTAHYDGNIDVYLDEGRTQQVDAILTRVREAIDIAIEAGKRPQCQWDTPLYEEGFDALVPFLGDCRDLARVLGVAAVRTAEQGNVERSMQILLALRQLGVHAAEEPMILGLLVHLSIQSLALHRFQEVFEDRPLSPELLDEFGAERISDDMVRRALFTEGTMGIDWINNTFDASEGVTSADEEMRFYVSSMLLYLAEVEQPNLHRIQRMSDDLDWQPLYQVGSQIAGLSSAMKSIERSRRNELAAQTAIALRRHRDKYGEYPETWDMPIDPLSSQPMIYRRTDAGFEITGSLEDDENPLLWQWQ